MRLPVLILALLLTACQNVRTGDPATDTATRIDAVRTCIDARPAPADLPPPVCPWDPAPATFLPANEALATLWLQAAHESDAVVSSLYGGAEARLDAALAGSTQALAASEIPDDAAAKPPAIIVDIDETILDNDAFNARGVSKRYARFDESWFDCWGEEKQARAYAGAVRFLDAAVSRGAVVFYVTNRRENQRKAVVETLRREGFPLVGDGTNVVFRGHATTSDDGSREKGARRQCIAREFRVAMMFGDNLGDFIDHVDGSPAERRQRAADEGADARWGNTWFMLPNPVYGSWLGSLQKHRADGQPADADRNRNLETWVDPQLPPQ